MLSSYLLNKHKLRLDAALTMKTLLKKVLNILFSVFVSPIIFMNKLIATDAMFTASAQLISLWPGKSGSYARRCLYRYIMQHCSLNCFIGFGTLFSQKNTELYDGVYIGPQCNIGSCVIGKDTLLGSGVHILSGKNQHSFTDLDTPIQQQGGHFAKVHIGEDSWLGNGAIVMANVGKKCIVAAGSVVTKDVPDYSIVAGNPAVIIRDRRD